MFERIFTYLYMTSSSSGKYCFRKRIFSTSILFSIEYSGPFKSSYLKYLETNISIDYLKTAFLSSNSKKSSTIPIIWTNTFKSERLVWLGFCSLPMKKAVTVDYTLDLIKYDNLPISWFLWVWMFSRVNSFRSLT